MISFSLLFGVLLAPFLSRQRRSPVSNVVVHITQIMLSVNSVWRWDGDAGAGSLRDTETKALSCFERDLPC